MNKRTSNIFLSFILCIILLAAPLQNAYAQTPVNAGEVTLASLGKTEVKLDGPFDSSSVSFGLPSFWKLNGAGRLDISLTTTINSTVDPTAANSGQSSFPQAIGGTLTVSFNRNTVATLVLNKVGTFDYSIELPAEVLVSPRLDGQMELKFTLDSGISCVVYQRMSVVINSLSRMTFQYDEQAPDTSLKIFPRPFVQSSIFPDQALVVIPDKPTAMELQSAFTVISGLGNMSNNKLGLDLVTLGQLTEEQKAANNLIFVGKAAALQPLAALTLPLKIQNGAFSFADGSSKDNGVVQVIDSPWAPKNVLMVVSGNTDLGTVKAGQAVSTGVFQENASPNLAIVEEILETPVSQPLVTDQSFADLGYAAQQFNNRGIDSQPYNFYIPSSGLLSSDAYLELAYGHSALLNFNTSGLVILLNGQPIGSARFDETSAGQAINRIRVSLPPSEVLPGNNRIEVRASLEPLDNCADPNLGGLWAVVWPESQLHLPFTSLPANTGLTMDLSAYPAPLSFDTTLGTTAAIFQRNDVESWRTFTKVAAYLGNQSNGTITKLGVFFDDEISGVDLSPYNLIVVGRPSQLKIMDQLNATLPVPFEKGSDVTVSKYLQVTYQIPLAVPVGYVELMPSPWNSEKVLIAAFGNTTVGVNWGISALGDQLLRSQLAGDFAVIDNNRVQTVDTRLMVPIAATPVGDNPTGLETPQPQQVDPTPVNSRPSWLLPALILTIALIIIIIIAVVFINLRNNRTNN